MKYRIPVALAIVAAFIVGAWALLRPPELPEYTSPSLALTGTDVRTASLQSKLGAASVLSIVPAVVVFLLLQRLIVGALTAGAVKG